MGAVYRARRTLLGDEVAIKVVRSGARRRRIARSILPRKPRQRPSSPSLHRLDSRLQRGRRGSPVPGHGTAQRAVPERGNSPHTAGCRVTKVQQIVPPLCTALQFAHDLGIVHRDLKPANIVAHEFSPGQRVYKIVDFGLANLRDSDETRLTGPHEFLGTIAYASPEQLTGGDVDSRSDIYSLGAVVFEMLTGRIPFGGPDAMSMLSARLHAPVPRVSEIVADIPAWLEIAVDACDREVILADRWATIADFGHALLAGEGDSTTVEADGFGPGRPDIDIRRRRAHRPRPARQRRLSRNSPRARPSRRHSFTATRQAAQLGRRAGALHARGASPSSCASVDHPGARLRRRIRFRLSRHRLHRRAEPARGHDCSRGHALAAAVTPAGAARRGDTDAASAQGPPLWREPRHHARHRRRRRRAPAHLERGRLAGAGSPGDVAGSTRSVASPSRMESCATPHRSC